MSNSLKDQLIALGLSKAPRKGQQRKNQQSKSRNQPTPKQSKNVKNDESVSLAQAYQIRASEEQSAADKARQKKIAADRKRRETNKKIKAIVKAHRLNDPKAELARNFTYKQRIRKITVTQDQLKALNSGQLGVVYLSGSYHLMAPEYVESVRQLSPEHVPDLAGDHEEDGEHPVPDDLVW